MLANTDNQYLVPTSGKPLRGLIQDHVVAGVWMCNKSSFFTRDQYFQLIYGALRTEGNYSGGGRIHTLPPAIFKPQPMWTGKQLVSAQKTAVRGFRSPVVLNDPVQLDAIKRKGSQPHFAQQDSAQPVGSRQEHRSGHVGGDDHLP